MLHPKFNFFCRSEDQLVEVVEDEFEGLGVALVDFDDLADAAGVEGLVFDAAEVAENLLNLFLFSSIVFSLDFLVYDVFELIIQVDYCFFWVFRLSFVFNIRTI